MTVQYMCATSVDQTISKCVYSEKNKEPAEKRTEFNKRSIPAPNDVCICVLYYCVAVECIFERVDTKIQRTHASPRYS